MAACWVIVKNRLLNIGIALDQLFYVLITLGAGNPDETLSAAAYRTEQQGKFLGKVLRPVIDCLFSLFEKQHCLYAFQAEKNRKHLPAEYS